MLKNAPGFFSKGKKLAKVDAENYIFPLISVMGKSTPGSGPGPGPGPGPDPISPSEKSKKKMTSKVHQNYQRQRLKFFPPAAPIGTLKAINLHSIF